MRAFLRLTGALIIGVLVAAVGTVMHRSTMPWGMVLSLALVLTAGVGVRAGAGRAANSVYVLSLLITIAILSRTGSGGDVLIPADGIAGWAWLGGAVVVGLLAVMAPEQWFANQPLRRTGVEHDE